MQQVLVSIIVPVFNVRKYLERCIKSILSQSYRFIEVILVDDGSTDGCADICDSLSKTDPRIVVIHKLNEGQGLARNIGIDISKGDYLLFVDSDDYIENDMVEKLVSKINDNTDLVICNGFFDYGWRIKDYSLIENDCYVGKDELFRLYFKEHKIMTGPVMKLIRSSIMNDVRFPNFRCNEDVYILHEIFDKCSNICLCTDKLYYYFIREDSSEHKPYYHDKLNLILANDKMEEYAKTHYPEYLQYLYLNRLDNIYGLLVAIIRSKEFKSFKQDYFLLQRDFDITYDKINNTSKKFKRLRKHKTRFLIYEKIKAFLSVLKRQLKIRR